MNSRKSYLAEWKKASQIIILSVHFSLKFRSVANFNREVLGRIVNPRLQLLNSLSVNLSKWTGSRKITLHDCNVNWAPIDANEVSFENCGTLDKFDFFSNVRSLSWRGGLIRWILPL
jgi:hypothetical protein